MNFKGIIQALAPRVIGAGVAAAAGWIYGKTKGTVQIDAEGVSAMLLSYAIAHRVVSSQVNPGDAAKGRLAEAEKRVSETGGTPFVQRPE